MDSPTQPVRTCRRAITGFVALCALVLSGAALSAQAPSAGPRLRLVSTAWPPFTNGAGQPRFALDLVEEALKRAGVTATTSIVSDPEFTPMLLRGDYDGSAAAWKDPERERVLLFSEPYLENRLVLVGRRGSNVSATSLAALAGRRVALVGGYSYGDDVAAAKDVEFVPAASEEDSLTKLLRGDADYTLMDELVVEYIVSHYPTEARTRLAIGETPLVRRSLYLALRRDRLDSATIIRQFNEQLRSLIVDRTYHRLLHVDWIRADVDGDGRPEFIPASDAVDPTAPDRAYSLTTSQLQTTAPPQRATGPRFYVGGSIYETWTAVPERYKVRHPDRPDPDRSSFDVFQFVW